MPIRLPKELPARRTLEAEGVELLDGARQATPPLRVALLNLMPRKTTTEIQIARLLGSADRHVDLTLFVPDSYTSKSMPADYLAAFYEPWSRVRDQKIDGLIVTGAPVEKLAFEAVSYWRELTEIFDWAHARAIPSLHICWAAQAALYHFHRVPKHQLNEKMFGLFRHRTLRPDHALLKGFDAEFMVPVSRHTEVRTAGLPKHSGLEILVESPESGLCLIEDEGRGATYMFNHLEYDNDTLKGEYHRDLGAGKVIGMPKNYFPGDNPDRSPPNTWRSHAHLLFHNWLDKVARARGAIEPKAAAIEWLLAQDRKPALIGGCASQFLIMADPCLDALPTVLRCFAAHGLSPSAVKVHRREWPSMIIELRLERVTEAIVERISRQLLLHVREIRRVAYRSRAGAGGILAGERVKRLLDSNEATKNETFVALRSSAA